MPRPRFGKTLAAVVLAAGMSLVFAHPHPLAGGEDGGGPTPSALEERARELLGSFPEATSQEARESMRDRLFAMADTLEADSSDVLASHCLERAGMACYYLGDFARAVEAWDRGLVVAKRSGDRSRVAALLNARGVGASVQGDNNGAIAIQTELLALRRGLGDRRGEAVTWHNLAYSYLELYRYPEAIECLDHAMALHRETGNTYGLAASMHALSGALFQMGQLRDALVLADSAVAVSERVGQPQLLGLALSGRGLQYQHAGRYAESLSDFDRGDEVLGAAGVARMLAINRVNRASTLVLVGRCQDALAVLDDVWPTMEELATTSERAITNAVHARALIDCGRTNEGRARIAATTALIESIRDSLDTDVARAEALRAGGWAYADLAALESAAGHPVDAWLALENGSATLWRSRLGLAPATPDDLDRLHETLRAMDAVAIQFGHATQRNAVAIVTPDSVSVVPFRVPPGLMEDVASALDLMSSGAPDDECAPALDRIAADVLVPFAGALDRAATRLIVIPGAFGGVPFEALPIPGTSETVGDRFAVSYAPSAGTLLYLDSRPAASGPVVVFADPGVPDAGADTVTVALRSSRLLRTPLPEARKEAREVASRAGTLFVGDDARKTEFLERAPGAAIIHFATHAVVDGGHPDHSLIVLAGEDDEDAALTAGEIEATHLGADLVTLSGCHTAGGYVVPGEGALGLASAFHVAGARSVVSSRWDVEDGAARRFMEIFYGELRDGADRDRALQEARREMAREGFPYRDREAFVLTGVAGEPVTVIAGTGAGVPSARLVTTGVLVVLLVLTLVLPRVSRRRRGP